MDFQNIIDEYISGREEVKEYPNFGVRTILPLKRRKVRLRGNLLHPRKGQYELERCLTHKKRLTHRTVHLLLKKRCTHHLNLPVLSTEEDAAVDERVAFIQDQHKADTPIRDTTPINVLIDHIPGQTMCFTMPPGSSIKDVKLEIERKLGTPCKVQRLRCLGRPVRDSQSIDELRRGNSDLSLLLFQGNLRGGAPPVQSEDKGQEGSDEERKEVVEDPATELKMLQMFARQWNIPIETAKMMHARGQLNLESGVEGKQTSSESPSTKQSIPPGHGGEQAAQSSKAKTTIDSLRDSLPFISFSTEMQNGEGKEFGMKYIFGRKGQKANSLERKLSFLLLCENEPTKYTDEDMKVIWTEVIQKHTAVWTNVLSQEQKQGWQVSAADNMVSLDGEPLELRFSKGKKGTDPKITVLPFDAEPQAENSVVILLVDDSVVESGVKGHFSTSRKSKYDINFHGNSRKPYHAHITKNQGRVTVSWGDLMKQTKVEKLEKSKKMIKCAPRRFKTRPLHTPQYVEGGMIDCYESGDEGNSLVPCHEFKLFRDAAKTNAFTDKFCYEVMKFACACLNSRQNGTIHFGIVDEKAENAEGINFHPREIVGIPVEDQILYKDKLTDSINTCYAAEYREFARRCISCPEFVLVAQTSATSNINYVIEVDIDASFLYTNGRIFSVALPDSSGKKKNKPCQSYARTGAESSLIPNAESTSYKKNMQLIDLKRKQDEQSHGRSYQNVTRQLQRKLGENCGKLDNTVKRILVLSSTDDSITTPDYLKTASALSNIPWSYVIDFNNRDKSQPGFCQTLTNNSDFEIHDSEEFKDSILDGDRIPQTWVFANGMGDDSSSFQMEYAKWQLSGRLTGLDKLICKTENQFPQNEIMVMFLVSPGFSEIEAFTYGIFLRHFQEHAVCFYTENEQTEAEWMHLIVNQKKFMDEHTFLDCGIVGLPWEEFMEEVRNLTTDCQRGEVKIPLTRSTACGIERGHFRDKSVQIMNVEECDHLHELAKRDHVKYTAEKRRAENCFYSGEEVSMENFWFTENDAVQVIRRDVLDDLNDAFKYVLSSDKSTAIETIRLMHSRLSGGSTVARHFLWGMFHRSGHNNDYTARCCIVNSITPDTVSTLHKYWKYRNSERLPVLALIDDQRDPEFEILLQSLSEKIESEGPVGGVAIILLRIEPNSYPKEAATEANSRMCVFIDSCLSDKECTRFQNKYDEMKKNYGAGFKAVAERTLPWFIMKMQKDRKGRQSYARRLVQSALPDVNENERDLLKFLSMILISIPDDKYIYIASLNQIMVSLTFRKECHRVAWAQYLSQNAGVFLRFKNILVKEGVDPKKRSEVGLLFEEFAEAIVEWTIVNENRKIADIALDFMNSPAFPTSIERELLKGNESTIAICDKMYLALQGKRKSDKELQKKEAFSKLIQRILEKEKDVPKAHLDNALDVMKLGFQKMKRSVLAQQVARLSYIHGSLQGEREIYFDMAEEWVQTALDKSRNSYFLDTAGRICLKKLFVYFPQQLGRAGQHLYSDRDCIKALDICLESIKRFQESQKAACARNVVNLAGYCGEMDVMYKFLTIVANSDIFECQPSNVRKYICLPEWRPKSVPWTEEQEVQIKGFRDRYKECLLKVEESGTILKMDAGPNIQDLERHFIEYFVYIKDEQSVDDLTRWTQNTMFIQGHIGGGIFINVFNLYSLKKRHIKDEENMRELQDIYAKLGENLNLEVSEDLKMHDRFLLIIVKMALYSPFSPQGSVIKCTRGEFLETKANVEAMLLKEEEIGGKATKYCLMLSSMFQWPQYIFESEKWAQRYNRTLEKLKAMSRKVQRTHTETDRDTRGESPRRKKTEHTLHPAYPVTTLFYFGRGEGLDMYVHSNELNKETMSHGTGINWEHPYIRKRLRRFSGKRTTKWEISLKTHDDRSINIKVHRRWQHTYSLEEVLFYVGFSWDGPLAHGVVVKK